MYLPTSLFNRSLSCLVASSLALLATSSINGQTTIPEISYPSPSLPAIKVGDPLPEDLVPTNSGGEVPNRPYAHVDTFAGSGSAGGANNTGTAATFNGPWGISRDAHGNCYVADFSGKRIRKITPGGAVSLIDEFGTFEPIGTAIDPATGHLYVSIAGHRILRYINKNTDNYPDQEPVYGPETDFDSSVIVYIGASTSGTTDASGTSARLNAPHALAVHDGFLYVADRGNNRIRMVDLSNAAVTTVTFTGGTLNSPEGILVALDGAIYVANTGGNDLIQKIQDGVISTYAGSGAGYANGMAAFAKFDNPRGLAMDAEGNLYVAEGNNCAIRRISPDGWCTPIAGSTNGGYNSSRGYQDGIGSSARFDSPRGIVLAPDGLLYITDNTNHRIRRLSLTGYEIEPPLPAGLALDPATGVISGTATELTPEGGDLFPHYVNNFQNGVGNATLHGAAVLTFSKEIQLTQASANQTGGITIPAGNLNVQELEVSFTLKTGKASGGGQGLSYNFGEGVSGESAGWAESGIGSGLSLAFDSFGESGEGIKGIRLLYGNKPFRPGIIPGVNGVLAYSPSVAWAGKASVINLAIDPSYRVTLSIDNQTVFSDVPLPVEYAAADKSSWTHAILARTDATANDEFSIDDLSFRQSFEGAARYRVTARNSVGSATTFATINIKEAPAVFFDITTLLKEDAENTLHSATGRDWVAMASPASGSVVVGAIAGDINARRLIAIRSDPSQSSVDLKTLHIYDPETDVWRQANTSQGLPLYGNWEAVASSADGEVLLASGDPESSTNQLFNRDTPGKIAWSTDGGTTWQTRPIGLSGAWGARSVAMSADGNTFYAAASQWSSTYTLNNSSPGALLVSRNRGATWSELYPAGTPYAASQVSCDASGSVLALDTVGNTQNGSRFDRLLVSTNGGANWTDRTPAGWSGLGQFKVTEDGKSIYAIDGGTVQLHVSRDFGANWTNTYPGDPSGPDKAGNCRTFAVSSDGQRVAQFNEFFRMVMSRDAVETTTSYSFTPLIIGLPLYEGQLVSNHSGRRLVAAYASGIYFSQGSGIELAHGKGDSHVISVTLSAPGGFLRVTPQEGITVVGNGTGNLTLTGPMGLINSTLESLTYQGGADFTGAAAFTITASASGVSTTQTSELTIEDADQPEMAALPTSSTITETSATLGGTVLGNGGSSLTRRGVVISPTNANPSPVRGGNEVMDFAASGTSLGAFTVAATDLLPGTTYSFRAYAVNANGPQYSDLGTFTTAGGSNNDSPSASWRLQHFGTHENSGVAADLASPDGDGIANLIKYALGLAPGENSSHLLPKPSFKTDGDQRYLSIRLNRIPARDDVTIIVEAQSGLGGAWTEIARSENGGPLQGAGGVTETAKGDGTMECEVRDTMEMNQAATRFMRVRISR